MIPFKKFNSVHLFTYDGTGFFPSHMPLKGNKGVPRTSPIASGPVGCVRVLSPAFFPIMPRVGRESGHVGSWEEINSLGWSERIIPSTCVKWDSIEWSCMGEVNFQCQRGPGGNFYKGKNHNNSLNPQQGANLDPTSTPITPRINIPFSISTHHGCRSLPQPQREDCSFSLPPGEKPSGHLGGLWAKIQAGSQKWASTGQGMTEMCSISRQWITQTCTHLDFHLNLSAWKGLTTVIIQCLKCPEVHKQRNPKDQC